MKAIEIVQWECSVCNEVYDDIDEAEECCLPCEDDPREDR